MKKSCTNSTQNQQHGAHTEDRSCLSVKYFATFALYKFTYNCLVSSPCAWLVRVSLCTTPTMQWTCISVADRNFNNLL